MGPPAPHGRPAPAAPTRPVPPARPSLQGVGGRETAARTTEPGGSGFLSWLSHLFLGEVPASETRGPYLSNGDNDESHLTGLLRR